MKDYSYLLECLDRKAVVSIFQIQYEKKKYREMPKNKYRLKS